MGDDNDIISGFESESIPASGAIDFHTAQQLDSTGSTCDVYVTRHHRRRVFVKRLKEEFRNNSVYLAALDKEFETGATLHHKSLPEYREFHDDYIVIDYIDGVTLAEILRSSGNGETAASVVFRWLKNPENLKRILTELIEVTGYLHRHNVVHCDIKPDNVIITDGTNNLMLIDFDKSYTPWLDDTSGSPALYGVDPSGRGDTDIDFHGIGHIINSLIAKGFKLKGLSKLRDRCFDSGVTADDLLGIILPSSVTPLKAGILLIVGFFIVCLAVVLLRDRNTSGSGVVPVSDEITHHDTIVTIVPDTLSVEKTVKPSTAPMPPAPRSKFNLEETVSKKLQTLYDELNELTNLVADTSVRPEDIEYAMSDYRNLEENRYNQLYEEVGKALNSSDAAEAAKETWKAKAFWKFVRHRDSIWEELTMEWLNRIPGPKPAKNT